MKKFVLFIIVFVSILSIMTAQDNPYAKDVILIKKTPHAGTFEGSRALNDQYEIDIYVRNYTIEKGKKVCTFYKELYQTIAKKTNNRVTININLWSKKILPNQIDDIKLQDKYYKGGINYNYANGKYFEDIY